MEQENHTPSHQRLNTSVRISTRYNNVLFPLDIRQFAFELTKNGYAIVVPPLPEQITIQSSIIMSAKFNPFAKKGNTVIDIDTSHQHIGIKDVDTKIVAERYKELNDILKKIPIGGRSFKPWFTEYQISFKIRVKENAWKLVSKKFEVVNMNNVLKELIGNDIGVTQIKVAWPPTRPDTPNYFEFILTPTMTDDHLLDFIFLFRASNQKKFMDQEIRIDEYIDRIIEWLEEDTRNID